MIIDKIIDISKALLTPMIGLLGIYIAYQQWQTNERKRKQDLFERRWTFYTELKLLFENLMNSDEAATVFCPTDFCIYNNRADQAKYLFGEDIVEHIFNIQEIAKSGDYNLFSEPFDKYLIFERSFKVKFPMLFFKKGG